MNTPHSRSVKPLPLSSQAAGAPENKDEPVTEQLHMFDIMSPPPPPPVRWCDLPRRTVEARAYGEKREFTLVEGDPDPFEMEVRGIVCTIGYSVGFCTYAVEGHGSLFWSETGFRSFGRQTEDRDTIRAMIEAYIDAPTKDSNGMGGKLVRWWPGYATQWREGLGFILKFGRNRADLWDQWGPEKHAEVWAARDADFEAGLQRMRADGIDPNDLGKPRHFRGAWPRITYSTKLQEFST